MKKFLILAALFFAAIPAHAQICPGSQTPVWSLAYRNIITGQNFFNACVDIFGVVFYGPGVGGTNDWLNVKAFGALGGARQSQTCSVTNASRTITDSNPIFQAGIEGYSIFGVSTATNPGTDVFGAGVVTTITARNSATSITVAAAANQTSAATCTWGPTADDGPSFLKTFNVTGTNSTCVDEANSAVTVQNCYPKPIYIPCDGYMIASTWYSIIGGNGQIAPSILGCGRLATTLYYTPAAGIPANFPHIRCEQCTGFTWRDFNINGSMYLFPNSAQPQFVVRMFSGRKATIENLDIFNMGFSSGGQDVMLDLNGTYNVTATNFFVQGAPSGDLSTACTFEGGFAIKEPHCGNHFMNAIFSGFGGRGTVANNQGNVYGGFFDECGRTDFPCVDFNTNSIVNFFGAGISGAATNQGAMNVDGTSTVYLTDANVGSFTSANNFPAMTIQAGGKVFATGSTIRGNGTAVAVVNSGLFQDIGGNTFQNCVNAACTPATIAQSFSGNSPVASLTHSTWNGFCQGTITANEPCGGFTPDQPIQVTAERIDFGTQGVTCAPAGTVTISNGTTTITVTLTNATSPVTQATFGTFASGIPIAIKVATIGTGCGTVPANLNVNFNWMSDSAP